MKEPLINHFSDYLSSSKIKAIRLSYTKNEVFVTSSLISYRLFIDLIIVILAAYGIYTIDNKDFYLIPIIFVCALIIIKIWIDFRPFNRIKVDITSKKINIISRNIIQQLFLRYILNKHIEYNFNDIDSIAVRSNESTRSDFLIYFVEARLKGKPAIILVSFEKEGWARQFASFFTELITNH